VVHQGLGPREGPRGRAPELSDRIARATPPGIAVLGVGRDLKVTLAEGDALRGGGSPPAAMVGRSLAALLRPEHHAVLSACARSGLAGRLSRIEFAVGDREYEVDAIPLCDAPGRVAGVMLQLRLLTPERPGFDTLAFSERRYRLLAEQATDVISRHTPMGEFLWVSPSIEGLLGFLPDDLVGQPPEVVMHPDDLPELITAMETLRRGEPLSVGTYRFRHRDGTLRWVETALRPVRGEEGGLREIVAAGRDVTDRVAAERSLAQHNDILMRFAATASHDLATPLIVIRGYAELLGERTEDRLEPSEHRMLETIATTARRMQALLDAFLEHSTLVGEQDRFAPRDVDLGAALEDALGLLQAQVEETGAEVRLHEYCRIEGDPALVTQLLMNLLANAMKFVEGRPEVDVFCRPVDGGCALEVRDNGIGIAEEDQHAIFGAFERGQVDPAFHGHGLGLATVRWIAERHGGEVSVASRVGLGSTFRVVFPNRMGDLASGRDLIAPPQA
jgi:PAS domain S-box-containing protein